MKNSSSSDHLTLIIRVLGTKDIIMVLFLTPWVNGLSGIFFLQLVLGQTQIQAKMPGLLLHYTSKMKCFVMNVTNLWNDLLSLIKIMLGSLQFQGSSSPYDFGSNLSIHHMTFRVCTIRGPYLIAIIKMY